MKSFMLGFFALLILATCAKDQTLKDAATVTLPEVAVEAPALDLGKIPTFECYKGCTFTKNYIEAFGLLKYANTDEFEHYFLKKRKQLSHVDGKSPELVIKTFRAQLSTLDKVTISFYWAPWSSAIGAWDVDRLKENSKFKLAPKFLAPHIAHELTHIFGWKHVGNRRLENDNLNSFPYAFGNEFEAYLLEKGL